MYKITSNTRRVTQRMVNEGYKWLYRRILDGGYNMNKCLEGEALIISMQEAGGIDQESYERFVELTETRPFFYMLSYKASSRRRKITTGDILNYFVEFNDYVFPVGFLMDFFEDDYETREEIHTFIKKYIVDEKEKMFIQFKKEMVNKNISHEKLMAGYPNIFKTKPAFFVYGILKLVALGVLLYLFTSFINTIHLPEILKMFFESDMQFNALITAPLEGVSAYTLGGQAFTFNGMYTYGQYFTHFLPHILANAVLLLFVLIGRTINAIRWIIAFIYLLVYRIQILVQNLCVKYLEKTGFAEIQEYFDTVIDELCEERQITDATVENIPKARRFYVIIANFDPEKINRRLGKATYEGKLLRGVGLNYITEDDYRACRRVWSKGIRTAVFWLLVFICMNVPSLFETIATKIANVLAP